MGVIFDSISVLSLYIVCDIHKKDIIKLNEYNYFIENYECLEGRLSDYNSIKKKNVSLELIPKKDKTNIDKKSFSYSPLSNIKHLTKEREVA